MERLLEVVAAAVPGGVIVVDGRTDPRTAVLERRSGALPGSRPAWLPFEQAAFLGEFIRRKERAWVDESILALGGLTPRKPRRPHPARRPPLAPTRDGHHHRTAGGVGFDPSRLCALSAREGTQLGILVKDLSRQITPTGAYQRRRETGCSGRIGTLTWGMPHNPKVVGSNPTPATN